MSQSNSQQDRAGRTAPPQRDRHANRRKAHLVLLTRRHAGGAAASPEAIQIAQAWALLAQGDSARAASLAANLLVEYPRNVSILALSIEAEVARTGAMAAARCYFNLR